MKPLAICAKPPTTSPFQQGAAHSQPPTHNPVRQGRYLLHQLLLKKQRSVGKMAERIKVLADWLDDLSLIPETYMVEERTYFSELSSDFHVDLIVHQYAVSQIPNIYNLIIHFIAIFQTFLAQQNIPECVHQNISFFFFNSLIFFYNPVFTPLLVHL